MLFHTSVESANAPMNSGVRGDTADIITDTRFCVNRLRGGAGGWSSNIPKSAILHRKNGRFYNSVNVSNVLPVTVHNRRSYAWPAIEMLQLFYTDRRHRSDTGRLNAVYAIKIPTRNSAANDAPRNCSVHVSDAVCVVLATW